ncbi:MAG TPA: DUF2807 domain-containing protein [Thermoanaerobaculia bacterium]|jgi:hypothetical protein
MLQLLVFSAAVLALPSGQFETLEARNGAHVLVRQGAVPRVSVLRGDPRCVTVSSGAGDRLVIDKSGHDCRRGERVQIEVIVRHLSAAAVSNGGSLRTLDAFPDEKSIDAHVEHGGTLDVRSLAADRVAASVSSGGRILTAPRKTLEASVESGGIILYWGDAAVKQSVSHGGVVARGTAEEAEKASSELEGVVAPIPPIPPVPRHH